MNQPSPMDAMIAQIADGTAFSEMFGAGANKPLPAPPQQAQQAEQKSPWYNPYDDSNRMPPMTELMS